MMYKYTLNPQLRYELFEDRPSNTRWWDVQWAKQVAFISEIGAEHYNIFQIMEQLEKFRFYCSPKDLNFIPVGGWLIPVKYFEKEIIS